MRSIFQEIFIKPQPKYGNCLPTGDLPKGEKLSDQRGGVRERLKRTVLKTVRPLRVSEVRILSPPPDTKTDIIEQQNNKIQEQQIIDICWAAPEFEKREKSFRDSKKIWKGMLNGRYCLYKYKSNSENSKYGKNNAQRFFCSVKSPTGNDRLRLESAVISY